ncbi:hypothetical protein SAMN05660668_01614 [Pseudobutyrivibrio sp. AR14]|uniref:hypothetical protein n=1 Tax=Pseudobutyrivibrio sp. AR14 TaxID=1520804 RepID=UPI0008823E9F|nr:hypothetical protein [Pseudobutyrivibrio sp. AR14]SCY15485.1 hypothetical protein SAMN05660668_01614 [Pseudobutyrivibrio sp. AR14]
MKKRILLLTLTIAVMAVACGKQENDEDIIGGADAPTVIELESTSNEDEQQQSDEAVPESEEPNAEESDEVITDDQALSAIRKYCIQQNPDLEEMAESDDYTLYWNVESSDAEQIVVAYRSYTAAIVRYYVDVHTGDTYATEFVPDIMDEEEKTGENFNIRDYIEE